LSINRIKRLTKEGIWLVAGQITAAAASLVLVRVLTEHLDPAQYGQMALGLTIAGFINQVVMGGLTNGIIRFYSIAAEKQDLGGYLHATRRLMLYATLVTMVVSLLVITGLFWLDYWQWIALAAAALMFSVLSAYNGVLSGIQNAARQRAIVTLHGSLDAWLKIGLALVVMFWLGNSSEAVVIGYACSSLLVTFSQFVFLRRTIPSQKQQPTKDHKWMGQIWAYSIPFATWGIFGWAQQSSVRWALEAFTTTETVGLYSVVSQLGFAPIQMVTATALTFLTPIIFARSGDGSSIVRKDNVRELTKKLVILGLGITTIAVIVAAILHSYIFHLLVNDSFSSASYFLPWVVLAGGIFSVAQLYASRVMALLMTKKIIPASIGSSIIGIAAAIVGTYYFSLAGAVFSLVIHATSYFIWIVITARSIDKKEL
jgi:O-antigen/teichoic acid export membrane protein